MKTLRYKREYTGEGIEQGITPTCSCGWRGRTEYAWNDWQMTNIAEQEQEHARSHFLAHVASFYENEIKKAKR